jgi:hypothetical protein
VADAAVFHQLRKDFLIDLIKARSIHVHPSPSKDSAHTPRANPLHRRAQRPMILPQQHGIRP